VDASPAIFLAKIGELGLLQLGAEEVFLRSALRLVKWRCLDAITVV
jgi:hypothetical protein